VTTSDSVTAGRRHETAVRSRPEAGDRVDSLPTSLAHAPAVWLAVIVVLSTIARVAIGLGVHSPWILPDEILYSDLARSIAAGDTPAVRGVSTVGWGVVYPTLIAPAWAMFGDPVWQYHAALTINALVMSSAAIPAYLLARLFVPRRDGVLVALLTVLVPSMAYTGVVMTENAFYPAFLWTMFLIARAIRRPTVASQLLALAGVAVLSATRIQGVVIGGVLVAGIVLYVLAGPRAERRAYLVRIAPTLVAVGVVLAAAVAALVARGPNASLGSRSGTFDALRPGEVPEWFAYLLGGLVLYVALIPAAASVVVIVRGIRRRAPEPERLFASIALPTMVVLPLMVSVVSASIDVDGRETLNERYVFYLVPLLFLGLAIWIRAGLPRPRLLAAVAAGSCAALALLVPIDRFEYNAGFQSPSLLPWLGLSDSRVALAVAVGAFVAIAAGLWLRSRTEHAPRLWLVVGVWMTLVAALTVGDNSYLSSVSARAFTGRPANWVDRAVPPGETVAVVWRQEPRRTEPEGVGYWLMVTEMFNPSVGQIFRAGPETYYEDVLPTVPVIARPGSGRLERAGGAPLEARYVLVTCRWPVVGRVVATAPYGALQLVEASAPLRLAPRGRCPAAARS
jgi:MFS family permease